MTRFRQDTLEYPYGITVSNEHVFITDRGVHTLWQFVTKRYELVIRTGTKESEHVQLNPLMDCVSTITEMY